MTEKLEIYKCNICGNLVQVLINGMGELVCCGEPMQLLIPKTTEEDTSLVEKHVPIIKQEENARFVKLEHHPMTKEHFIQFIEVYSKDKSSLYLKFFNPNEPAELDITYFEKDINAIEHCNLHGLWRNIND
ncbi:desulfoferrodoxin FeS4 iron-binding domain-containing protein [bacterium]|nr:desulfoferrodoxin FeS4 iron-binding domain-containing protein [bacterium]